MEGEEIINKRTPGSYVRAVESSHSRIQIRPASRIINYDCELLDEDLGGAGSIVYVQKRHLEEGAKWRW